MGWCVANEMLAFHGEYLIYAVIVVLNGLHDIYLMQIAGCNVVII